MGIEEDAFDHSTFTKNRDRLIEHEVATRFFEGVIEQARREGLISKEHFTVDGTLIEAWASMKSVRPKDEKPEDRPPPDDRGNPTVNFRGERRRNETHGSTTDPEALLARKGDGKVVCPRFPGVRFLDSDAVVLWRTAWGDEDTRPSSAAGCWG